MTRQYGTGRFLKLKTYQMGTISKNSPIEKIHARGMRAIIDGDNQRIVGEVHPDQIRERIISLEMSGKYSDVSQDADGDIVYYE